MAEDIILTEKQFQIFINAIEPSLTEEAYGLQCHSFEKLNKNKLPYIYNIDHLASILDFSENQLHLFISDKRFAYTTFELPKKMGGFRKINAPSKKMKYIQRWILDNILYKLNVGEYAHGFVPNKSIATNASVHVGQKLVFCIDIKDFFPSITLRRVNGLFRSMGYNDEISLAMAELCTYNWRIPQGAPTSPMISNLISWKMDIILSKFCEKRNLNYSRYADDITISGEKDIPRYKKLIFSIIKKQGFLINNDKVRLHDKGSRQKVTGLVVNDKVTLGRKKKKWLRAIVHNIQKNGPVAENRDCNPFFKKWIYGHLAFANMVEPDFAKSLYESLKDVNWSDYHHISSGLETSELNMRSLKRAGASPSILFDKLGFFKHVEKMAMGDYSNELLMQLDELKEKCMPHPTNEDCLNCIYKQDESYKKCIKYILAHFIRNTGGTHHGHELYDVGGETSLDDESVFVAFLAKSAKMDRTANDGLVRQFLDCTDLGELDILSVVTPGNLDHKVSYRLKRVMKVDDDKRCCLILRNEMGRILHSFNCAQAMNNCDE